MVCLFGSIGHKSRNHNDCPLNIKICKLKARNLLQNCFLGFLSSALFLKKNLKFKGKKLNFDTAELVQQIILAIKIVRTLF
jgi:hypothetical protein